MAKKKPKNYREIEAFAAFDDRLNLLYATIRPNKKESEDALRRFNPPVKGFPYPFKVMPISVGVDLNRQQEFFFDGDKD